jgi:hypothetical protein
MSFDRGLVAAGARWICAPGRGPVARNGIVRLISEPGSFSDSGADTALRKLPASATFAFSDRSGTELPRSSQANSGSRPP